MDSLGQPIAQGRTAQIFPWKDGRVVKLYFDWVNPDEAILEARINADIHAAGLPAPGGVEMIEVEGRKGILFERIEGPTLLQAIAAKPWRLDYYADLMADVHSQLHQMSLDWLRDARGNLYWAIEHSPAGVPEAHRALAVERLSKMPESNGVCHGDFHPENIILSQRGPVVIDWVNACRGQPAVDVARTAMMLSLGKPAGGTNPLMELARRRLIKRYMGTYLRKTGMGKNEVEDWELIVAVARWYEIIQNEREDLLAMIARCANRAVNSPEKD